MALRVNVTPGQVKELLTNLGHITVGRLILSEELTSEEITEVAGLFKAWRSGENVIVGDIRRYQSLLYKCAQAHTTQADWTPDVTPALWDVVSAPGVISDWVQPDSTNPYMTGDKVVFEDHIWESTIDDNVWSPTAYPAGWSDLGEK